MSYALEVHELWKSYAVGVRGCSARVSVLRGVSFLVERGERVGILGRCGAGKTTLLHCIAGLRRPDAGELRFSEPGAATMLLLDEGSMEQAPPRRVPHVATLIFARQLASLRGRVERVLVLRDGRIATLESPRATPADARRVAEPPGRVGAEHGSVR